MISIILDYLPVILSCIAAIVLFIGDKFSCSRKTYIIGVVVLLLLGAIASGINIWKNNTEQGKLLGLIKKSESNIGTLLRQVAAGNVDNKTILEKLEYIHEDLISEGKNIILVSGPQGLQGEQGLQGPQGERGLQGLQGERGLQGLSGGQISQGAVDKVPPAPPTGLQVQ